MSLTIFAAAVAVAAQGFEPPPVIYPEVPGRAAVPEAFLPNGWALEQQAAGDLNGDGVADAALIMRSLDPANIVEHDGLGMHPFDTNPRLLVVGFGLPEGGYALALADHDLIPRPDNPSMADVLEDAPPLEIARGSLKVSLRSWMSAGSWSMSTTTFTLRWRDGAFRLIGFDDVEIHRGSGEVVERSINYLTRRMSVATGSIETDVADTVWRRIPAGPLLTLDEIGNGLEFDPESR